VHNKSNGTGGLTFLVPFEEVTKKSWRSKTVKGSGTKIRTHRCDSGAIEIDKGDQTRYQID